MNVTLSEARRAKSAYDWLRISPLITIFTLFFVASMDIGYVLCEGIPSVNGCYYGMGDTFNLTFGVLVSGLWHLTLLTKVNDKESEFVRMHGQKALTMAGVRTGVAFAGAVLSILSYLFIFAAILVLIILWIANASAGKRLADEMKPILQTGQAEGGSGQTDPVSVQIPETERKMETNKKREAGEVFTGEPKEVLAKTLEALQSGNAEAIFKAFDTLAGINYSSEAVRRQLEKISVGGGSPEVRREALRVLNSPAHRAVQKQINANKLDRGIRYVILQEIAGWERDGLLEAQNADVLRRRYDFDIAPQSAATPVPAQAAVPTPKADSAKPLPAESPAPAAQPKPQVPPEPRPSLLQTLTSESAIRIYLYLGAFFVIAAAAILGAVVPSLRLPILMLGTLLFGGLAVGVKKRLPQPSFALFIVFSFLLPITANSLKETLQGILHFSSVFSNGYWALVFLIMAAVWSGSTWLYESRLFSLAAFGSLTLAFLRAANMFEAEAEVYTLLMQFAALLGLAGAWLLKKWKDNPFAVPLFTAAQLLHLVNLGASLIIFGAASFESGNESFWNLIGLAVWGLAAVFFIASNGIFPSFAFAWLAAGTLIPMPWFFASAFNLASFGSALTLFAWGAALSVSSEGLRRFAWTEKYGLPVLLASLPSLALALVFGFAHKIWLGLVIAAGSAFLFAVLHILHSRWWVWTLALLNAAIAYFAFFQLDFISRLDIYFGYQLTGIAILFLLPDLALKKDWRDRLAWRLPPRIFGVLFLSAASLMLFFPNQPAQAALGFGTLTVFCAVYALAYRNAFIAYLPVAYAPLAVVFALDALRLDAWLPALTVLAVFYYLAGAALYGKPKWGEMLRNSGMALGVIVSFTALILTKETGGWYMLAIGLLFIAEMYLRKNGWFEIGAPILFTSGAFLILRDFNVERGSYHLLVYSLIWVLSDLLAHLIFKHPRPLSFVVRIIGGLLALVNYLFLFSETSVWVSVMGYGMYALLFLTVSLVYRQPTLLYAFTLTLPLFVTFLFRTFDITQWIHPVIVLAMLYYAAGTFLRFMKRAQGWDQSLLYSGLGVGVAVSIGAPILGGLDASIPAAIAATLWAVEAFAKKNAWLAFPANGLYLLAYFIILFELDVNEPQFFSIGAALFGLIQHYLLTRAESKSAAFLMGMVSQFSLLGTTYIEMIGKNNLAYFFLLFVQSLIILVYGIVIRSRSLTFFPIGFVALGVVTVVYSALKDIGTIFVIGCTGIILLMLGVIAVLLRERIAKLGEKLSDWQA